MCVLYIGHVVSYNLSCKVFDAFIIRQCKNYMRIGKVKVKRTTLYVLYYFYNKRSTVKK